MQKYGAIYKSQKFDNADTVDKLFEYAKDWILNNYHGGITNFTATALDLRLAGNTEAEKITVGRRVKVIYRDPDLGGKDSNMTLTVISAEYDLQNPDKNQYKIGIPDVTLNKVYGETSKSGGGGGGGGKTSDETDTETNTDVDDLTDDADKNERDMTTAKWAMFNKAIKNGDLAEAQALLESLTPTEKDPDDDFLYGLTPDFLKTGPANIGEIIGSRSITSDYIKSKGGIDAETVGANYGVFNALKFGEDQISKLHIPLPDGTYADVLGIIQQ